MRRARVWLSHVKLIDSGQIKCRRTHAELLNRCTRQSATASTPTFVVYTALGSENIRKETRFVYRKKLYRIVKIWLRLSRATASLIRWWFLGDWWIFTANPCYITYIECYTYLHRCDWVHDERQNEISNSLSYSALASLLSLESSLSILFDWFEQKETKKITNTARIILAEIRKSTASS